jgi:sulfotransferase
MKDKLEKAQERRRYYFISGLPRSGSTLLANILAQNPKFHATGTSGIMDVMFHVRNTWNEHVEFRAAPNYAAELRVLRGILDSYFADVDKPVVFDKSRGWLSELEMVEAVLGRKVKVLVPVRDLRSVISSFEKLWRKNAPYSQMGQARHDYFQFQTIQGRVALFLRPDQPIGLAYNRIVDALNRGFSDRLFFIDFDDLTHDPAQTLKQVYEFLEEPYFEHNFDSVEQVTFEHDEVHGIRDLHKIRSKVAPVEPDWQRIIGQDFHNLENLNFWKKNKDFNPQPLPETDQKI